MIHTAYHHFMAMGTRFELVVPGYKKEDVRTLFQQVEREVKKWEQKLSRFDPTSTISRLNREASNHPVKIEDSVYEILEICQEYYIKTSGAFDITLLPLYNYWEKHPEGDNRQEMETVKTQCGMQYLKPDPVKKTVFFTKKNMCIDLGGFGKGYALLKTREILEKQNIQNALVSFGESSILALGKHPHGSYWPVGIRHIFNPASLVYEYSLSDTALSTSGVSEQRQPTGKKQTLHIINPFTGQPVSGWRTLSVEAEDPLTAEVLSTALLCLNPEGRKAVLNKFPSTSAIEITYKGSEYSVTHLR